MTRIRINVTVDLEVWQRASAAGLNVSRLCEEGIAQELAARGVIQKTPSMLGKERESREALRREEAERREEQIHKAYAAGKFVADERTGPRIPLSALF